MICKVCGKEYKYGDIGGHCSSTCFSKHFWEEKIGWMEEGDITPERDVAIRVKGTHYIIMPDDASECPGCGGQQYHVRINIGPHAGKVITTRNLWSQGEIPEWTDLYDNAVFITDRIAADYTRYRVVRPDEGGENYLEEIK